MSPIALVEETSVEAAPAEPARPALGAGRLAVLGAAVVVGVPAGVEVGRFVTTIVLSLILGH